DLEMYSEKWLPISRLSMRIPSSAFSTRPASYFNPQSEIRNPQFLRFFENAYSLDIIVFLEHHFNDLGCFGRNDLSDKVGLDRQFTMFAAAIDKDGKLHFSRAAKVH